MKYEVFIDDNPSYISKRIFITFKQDGKRWIAKPVELTFEEMKSGEIHKPTLDIPDADELLEALAIALNKAKVQLPDKPFIEGKMVATEKHLEDMRNLVFKEKK